jgi:hypothetical protein
MLNYLYFVRTNLFEYVPGCVQSQKKNLNARLLTMLTKLNTDIDETN